MSGRLPGRIAMVTGAGGGIGAAVAARFGGEGAAVAVVDRDEAAAAAVAGAINDFGGRAMPVGLDVSDEADVRAAVARIADWAGPVGVLVNCAGNSRFGMFHKLESDAWRDVLSVHLDGSYYCARAVVETLPRDGTGRIINVTSAAGLTGTIGQANYGAAKAGLIGLTKSLAKELGRHGITANAVAPIARTAMTTNMEKDEQMHAKYLERIPLRRVAEPAEIAGAFVFLASDDASYVTGQVLCVDGGLVM
jgi:3-oxoacyl-[acyl-carrier protein] reductase